MKPQTRLSRATEDSFTKEPVGSVSIQVGVTNSTSPQDRGSLSYKAGSVRLRGGFRLDYPVRCIVPLSLSRFEPMDWEVWFDDIVGRRDIDLIKKSQT